MALIVPTENSDAGTWDEILNTAFEAIDEHDHTTGNGVAITPAAMDINADLAMASHSLTGLQSLDFNAIAAAVVTSRVRTIYWNTSDGNLYAKNGSGQTIQITNGGQLDVSLVGGIGGDYTTTDAEVTYDNTNGRYKFLSDASPETYAKITAAVAQLTNGSYTLGIIAPTLAANATVTMPLAVGSGQTRLLTIDDAGVIEATDGVTSIDGAIEFNGAITLDAVDIKHGTRDKMFSAMDANYLSTFGIYSTPGNYITKSSASVGIAQWSFPMEVGQRIRGYAVDVYQTTTSTAFEVLFEITKRGANVATNTTTYSIAGASSWKELEYSAIFGTITAGDTLHMRIRDTGGGAPEVRIGSIRIRYDRV